MSLLPTSVSSFPLLVVLNPHAGKKQGQQQFSTIVKPALDKAERPFRLIETTAKGHALTYFKENTQQILSDLAQSLATGTSKDLFLRIMVLGGDGTVHEIVNGILGALKRLDFLQSDLQPKIEFSVAPTGTGNSIATSLGISCVQDAIDRYLSGNTQALRIMTVSTRDERPLSATSVPASSPPSPVPFQEWNVQLYTVVVNSFGLHAATVYEAEGFRSLGNDRFKVSALKNIALLQQYPAKLDLYGPIQRYDSALRGFAAVPTTNATSPDEENTLSLHLPGPFTYLLITKQASLEPGFTPTPLARASDEWLDVLAVQNTGRLAMLKILGGAKSGTHIEDARVQYFKAKAVELETPQSGRLCVDGEFLPIGAGSHGRVRFEIVSDPRVQLFHVFS
ncbi:hypothetical protein MVEG_08951 [Podila verticillata NRRL 6337]|nr:hypothetical protein MVEG_08951 [Podila verticillata NRRL 6337]